LCDEIHRLGLKAGIYSTPWGESYARFIGGSAENPEGTWEKNTAERKLNQKVWPNAVGKYSFASNDAKQWGAWGIDYLKYDWSPNEEPETADMANALRTSGRDIVFSLSNNAPFENVDKLSKYANSWRNTGDIRDNWFNVMGIVMKQPRWTSSSRPGHWNDPDMLVVGVLDPGSGKRLHPSKLTPDQQYFHISLWSLLASPLLIGCDMTQLDDFTLNLLTNDEVLAINQDPLGKQAKLVFRTPGEKVPDPRPPAANQTRPRAPQDRDTIQIYARDLEDGSKAVGLFNLREESGNKAAATWADLGLSGPCIVRDVWRQQDLGEFNNEFSTDLKPCGSMLIKITPKK
jgi:alpha-galactosidase